MGLLTAALGGGSFSGSLTTAPLPLGTQLSAGRGALQLSVPDGRAVASGHLEV